MRRRDVISLLGGAAASPRIASSQLQTKPVIGFLNGAAAAPFADRLRGFHQGLKEAGYVEGENVAILPVVRSTRFDLVLNLKTARSLGIAVPATLLSIADEVIE